MDLKCFQSYFRCIVNDPGFLAFQSRLKGLFKQAFKSTVDFLVYNYFKGTYFNQPCEPLLPILIFMLRQALDYTSKNLKDKFT